MATSQNATHVQPAMIAQIVESVQPAAIAHQEDSTTALAKAITESINKSHLPIPEPSVFDGEPLRYKDWKTTFETLIGRKNIPVNEKVFYLHKYVGGPAKKRIEGYFLLGTDAAYYSALDILEERYGSSILIAKAFRDKITSWPKIGPKDSIELRELSNFRRSCEAMSQIKSLAVLKDCGENQRMLNTLHDWLTARWNRKVFAVEESTHDFPSFSEFVQLVAREAKIACNPVTSLNALKSGDSGKVKTPKPQNVGAKVMASSSEENPDPKTCVFLCEKLYHGIQTCRKKNNLRKSQVCAN